MSDRDTTISKDPSSGRPVQFNEPGAVHHRHRNLGWGKSHHVNHVPEEDGDPLPLPEPLEPECPVCSVDITHYPIDDLTQDFTMPSLVNGGAAGSIVRYGIRESQSPDLTYNGFETWLHPHIMKEWRSASYVGAGYWPHTAVPEWATCHEGLDFVFSGWVEEGRILAITLNEFPDGMAGIAMTVSGYTDGVTPESGIVYVQDTFPEAIRSGMPVATVPLDTTGYEVFIPASMLPGEGGTFYVTLAPGWTCEKGLVICGGGNWPFNTHEGNSARGNFGVNGWWGVGNIPVYFKVYDGEAVSQIGVTPDWPDARDGGPRFDGGLPLSFGGTTGTPSSYGIADGRIWLTATTPASLTVVYGQSEDTTLELPWDGEGWSYMYEFRFDVAGDTSSSGSRYILTDSLADDHVRAYVFLGDASRAPGIGLDAGGGVVYLAHAMTPGEMYGVRVDTRSGEARMKVWALSDGEPARWMLTTPILPNTDDGDRFEITLAGGNGSAPAQTIEVWPFKAALSATPGHWVDEYLGVGDGEYRTFTTTFPYEPASLMPRIDGLWIEVDELVPSSGTFRTDNPVARGAPISARYQVMRDYLQFDDEVTEGDE